MLKTKISKDGRVVVPKHFREMLGISVGDEVLWTEIDGQIVLTTRMRQIEHAQKFFAALTKDYLGGSMVDELIAERRAEATQEELEATTSATRP